LVKGQGLAKLLAESNFRALGINHRESHGYIPDIEELDDQTPSVQIEDKFVSSYWYRDIVSYLLTLQCLGDMTTSKEITLKLHEVKYCIIEGQLYWKDPLGFLLGCLTEAETENVINEFHEGVCGGHHAWRETTYKILRPKYYWPKLFTDLNAKVRACNPCQLFSGKKMIIALPLV
jgi:hypothetical protein